MRRQPVREFEQASRRRRDRAMVVGHGPARRDPHARDDDRRVDIQPRTTRMQYLHQPPPFVSGTRVESPDAESKRSTAQRGAGVAIRGARGTPGQTKLRACRTNAQPTSVPVPRDTLPCFMTTCVRRRRVGN
jgi:hypothetical protein